jgi:ParB-like chromosome segregation protein Spo0J
MAKKKETKIDSQDWKGPSDLSSMLIDIESIKLDPRNTRSHPKKSIDALKKSLQEFGQVRPIVVKHGIVRAGNGTYQAAKEIGFKQIAVIDADNLTDAQINAYAIADNRIAELSEWNPEALKETITELSLEFADLSVLAFSDTELELLSKSNWEPKPVNTEYTPSNAAKTITLVFNDLARFEFVQDKISEKRKQNDQLSIADVVYYLIGGM